MKRFSFKGALNGSDQMLLIQIAETSFDEDFNASSAWLKVLMSPMTTMWK